MIWIAIALVASVVAIALAWPMLRARPTPAPPRTDFDLAVYRDQLEEIDRDHARGMLSDTERDAARLEIERRVLAVAELSAAAPRGPRGSRRRAWAAMAAIVPAVAVGLYFVLGAPSLAVRSTEETAELAQRAEVARYVERLIEHLRREPNDARGWSMLGRSYMLLGQTGDAIAAYERAVALAPHDADLASRHAEARILAEGGTVGEDARRMLARALALDARDPRARFYQAIGEEQAGHGREALSLFLALEADTPADAAWRPVVAARIDRLAREMGLDPAKVPGRAPAAAPESEPAPPPGASAEEQAKMIRGMVEGLAARLAREPNDPAGWARLGRSYGVLGEPAKSRDAWRRAAELTPDDPQVLAAYASSILAVAGNTPPPPEFAITAAALLRLAPENPDALWFAGVAARARGDDESARRYWERLLERLPAESPAREEITRALDRLSAR